MINALRWEGDRDGHLALSGDAGEESMDRLGDLMAALHERRFREPGLVGAAGAYGICLATRGVKEPLFILQVMEKAIQYVTGCHPESVSLYKSMQRMKCILADNPEDSGLDLRDRVLQEAHTIHGEAAW